MNPLLSSFLPPAAGESASLRAAGSRLPRESSLPPLRILAVDDEPAVLEVIALCLTADGHQVDTAPDGASALERFRASLAGWDLVVLDRAMPGLSGGELALALKELNPNVPVVMITGSQKLAQELGPAQQAIDAFVWKPFTMERLREGITQAMRALAL
jgi:CheY-like chemotaxis protein